MTAAIEILNADTARESSPRAAAEWRFPT